MRGKRLRQTGGLGFREHPRVCGENHLLLRWPSTTTGISPRMRGKPDSPFGGGVGDGNIPAYAGKTVRRRQCPQHWLEHPRVCGENLKQTAAKSIRAGTSPRMRGKRLVSDRELTTKRNIPAYAGKTPTHGLSPLAAAEHPRVCGENKPTGTWHSPVTGTSPRMRGKRGQMG